MEHYYAAFGGRVCSDVPMPELPSIQAGPTDWTLSHATDTAGEPRGTMLGSATKRHCRVSLWRHGDGYRMHHSCVGDYEIAADGARVVCWRDNDATDVAVQNDMVTRILPLVFHSRGAFCLHASGVVIHGDGIAFVGDPRLGKSTLAYALVQQGARICSDDVVILETRPSAVMRQGVERLRLCRDATERLVRDDGSRRSPLDGKDVIELHRPESVSTDVVPLRAIYVLAPFRPRGREEAVVRREVLPSQVAALLLVRHARLGRVLSGRAGGDMVVRAAEVVRHVPVYALHVMRSLSRIDDVATELIRWHSASVFASRATGTDG